MPGPQITVVGSINLDLVAQAERLPQPGETLTDAVFSRHPGGKGGNQALAARRLGASVRMVGRVGEDPFAEEALTLLRAEQVDLSTVSTDPEHATGVALIIVASDGENQIVVAPGANRRLAPHHVRVEGADAVICQLEIPTEVVVAAAAATTGMFCLNAAPARAVPAEVLARADLVVANQVERGALGDALFECDGLVAVTLGAEGAHLYQRGRRIAAATPPPVEAVDATGAGDAFCAALVVSLLEGMDPPAALRRACAAGAFAVTVPGAQDSLPTAEEVERLLQVR